MRNPATWAKERFSHVRSSSWHYRLVRSIWEKNTSGKACVYYWWKLPLALVAWTVMLTTVVVVGGIAAFFGYVITWFKASSPEMHRYGSQTGSIAYPYKHLPNGKRVPIVPWEIALWAFVGYFAYYMVFVNLELTVWIIAWVGAILYWSGVLLTPVAIVAMLIGGVVFGCAIAIIALDRAGKLPSIRILQKSIERAVNIACPSLVIEDDSTPEPAG